MNFAKSRILVVDDVPENRDLLVRRLRRLSLSDIAEAGNGREALDIIRSREFDLVLLDVMMPEMNGIEVLEAMRDENRLEDTPVVMISAASEMDKVVRCIELGAEDYLPKPFNPALLAARVRTVLERKLLRAENRRQLARLTQELKDARIQQLLMLPAEFPVDPLRWDIDAEMDPALEVGGDLYDVFEAMPGILCVAIGDVAGKGTAAALFMARTRSLLRGGTLQHVALSGRIPRPSEIAALINAELCKNNPDTKFVTLFVGFLDTASGDLAYCNAGHVYPILASRTGVREIENAADPALGVIDEFPFEDHRLSLAEGDLLVLTSDGLSDMHNPADEDFSTARILAEVEAVAHRSATDIVTHLLASALAFGGEAPQFDDITVLALRRMA